MTQSPRQPDKLAFPDKNFLMVRPSLINICLGFRPAAKLLSALIYRYNGDRSEKSATYEVRCTQEEMVTILCGEVTAKTLHDVGIPVAMFLGYLEVDESHRTYKYTIHIDRVEAALALHDNQPVLEVFLMSQVRSTLEKFPMFDVSTLEIFPIKTPQHKKNFQLSLEKFLMLIRNTSKVKRGRQPRCGAALEVISETPKNKEEIYKKDTKELPPNPPKGEKPKTKIDNSYSQDQQATDLKENKVETVIPPVASGYTNTSNGSTGQTSKPVIPDLRQGLREQVQESKQETPAQIKKRMELRKEDIFALYARLTKVAKVVKSKENQDGADMLVDVDATDEHITIAVEELQADPFWSKQMNLRTVASQLQNRVNERNKRKPTRSTKTLDETSDPIILMDEKTKRNAERSKQVLIDKFQERMDKKGKFQAFEIVHMVERLGMEVAPYLMEQYNALQQVAVSQ